MSSSIEINGNRVIKTSASTVYILCNIMSEIIYINQLNNLPKNLIEIIEAYSDKMYCNYWEIADYIENSKDLFAFLDLLEETFKIESKEFDDETMKELWLLYKKLIEYANELKLKN